MKIVYCLIITWYIIKRKWSPWSGIGLEKHSKKKEEEEEEKKDFMVTFFFLEI
jgi:hypothetical protein